MVDRITAVDTSLRVLVVDDDPRFRDLLLDDLRDEGYEVAFAQDGATAWLVLMGEPSPDLVVLDWTLPDVSGPELCKRMRANGIKIPVLMLTGHDDVSDRVSALDAGVDDYLVKPFAVEELLARLRALRRRRWALEGEQPDEILVVQDLKVNLSRQQVSRGVSQISLSGKEYALLLHLLEADGGSCSANELLSAVWGDTQQGGILLDIYAQSLMGKIDAGRPDVLIERLDNGGLRMRTQP